MICRACGGMGDVGNDRSRFQRTCPVCNGLGTAPTSKSSDVLLSELCTNIANLGIEVNELLKKSTQDKHRSGIAMHVKLKRLKSDLDCLSALYAQHPSFISAKKLLHDTTERVLVGVFDLNPEQLKEADVAPTSKLPVTDISGVSLAVNKTFACDEFASVSVRLNNITVEGIAKRDPADKPNKDIGLTLATGRALRKLGGQIINEANKAVAEADRERRKEQAAKAQARATQRKAERKVQAEKTAVEEAAELRRQLASARRTKEEQSQIIDTLRKQAEEQQRVEAARRARDYKQRIAKRKANAAAKKAPAKAKAKA